MSNKIIQHMKAKHIKKLRAQIKHYYARSATGLFGIYTGKSDMMTNGTIIYGRNASQVVNISTATIPHADGLNTPPCL